jgi:hypothetical protein
MQSKARMTIRFDPPKPNEPKMPTRQTTGPLNEMTTEDELKPDIGQEQNFASWTGPYQDDIRALEDIIRKTDPVDRRTPWTRSPVKDEPLYANPWPKQETPVLELIPPVSATPPIDSGARNSGRPRPWDELPPISEEPYMAREGPSWGRVFLSIVAAVATGALFGYIVLSLFTGEPLFPVKSGENATTPVQASPGTLGVPKPNASSEPQTQSSGQSTQSDKEVAALSQIDANMYYMLQYGVFKTEESMKTAINQLKDKGLSSAEEVLDGYRVYVGAALTRKDAELLASQMPDLKVYIKPVQGNSLVVPSVDLSDTEVQFVNSSDKLIGLLVQHAGIGLQEIKPKALSEADMAELKAAYQSWLAAAPVADKLSGDAGDSALSIVHSLKSAMQSMTNFNQTPSRNQLWNTQSSVMEALLADHHLRMALQPTVNG